MKNVNIWTSVMWKCWKCPQFRAGLICKRHSFHFFLVCIYVYWFNYSSLKIDVQLPFSPQAVYLSYQHGIYLADIEVGNHWYLREQMWDRCYLSFWLIYLLNLNVIVLFLLMTPRYMQPVLTPNSVVQESQPIWMLLRNGRTVTVGACSLATKKVSTCTSGRQQDVTTRDVPIPEVKHHCHLWIVLNNKFSWTEHIKDVHGACSRQFDGCSAPTASTTSRSYCQGNFHRCHSTTDWTQICVSNYANYVSQIWDGGQNQSLQRLQDGAYAELLN